MLINEALGEFYKSQKKDTIYNSKELVALFGTDIFQNLKMDSSIVCGREFIDSTSIVNLHNHPFYEITLFESGNLQYLVENNRYNIKKGDILIVPSGFNHCPLALHTLKEPYTRVITLMNTRFLNMFLKSWTLEEKHKKFFENPVLLRTTGTPYEPLCYFLKANALRSDLNNPYSEAYVCGNMICFLAKLLETIDEDYTPARKVRRDLLDKIIYYVDKHLTKKITVQDICNEFYIGKDTLNKLFKDNFNYSFHNYLTLTRLNSAKNLFLTDLSFESIAEQVGFSDYSSFYRAFKKEFGISPKEYSSAIKSINSDTII